MKKRQVRPARDPMRILAPFGAVVIPLFVSVVLEIVLSYSPPELKVFDLDLARLEDQVDVLEEPSELSVEADAEQAVDEVPVEVRIDLPTVETEPIPVSSAMEQVLTPIRPETLARVRSPVTMKTLAGCARGETGRRQAMRRFGGNERAEAAVMRALRWIKMRQLPDGSWQAKGEGDATAFALLAYLSHGEDMASPEFGQTVRRAIQNLVDRHSNNMSVYALLEAANVVRTPVLKEVAEEALESLCQRQKQVVRANSGGLLQRYCAVMALKSAEMAKVESPQAGRVRETFESAFVEMRDSRAANWKKIQGKGTWHYMVAGVCLQYLGRGDDVTTRGMLGRLDELWPPATLGTTDIACCPVRSNYFSTMIFFNAGGKLWEKWNAGMLAAYAETQVVKDEGYVDPDGVPHETGYWFCKDQHIGDQPFWTTCYVAHQLMVYYRYLPTYAKEAWGGAAVPQKGDEEKDLIRVDVDI